MTFLRVKNFDQHIEQYLDERHHYLDYCQTGLAAVKRDLNLFSRFLHKNRYRTIKGDTILLFIGWLKNERCNCAGAINRKISSIRCYIKHLRFRQVKGSFELPVEYLGRARQPYSGPPEALTPSEVQRLLGSIDRESILGYRDYVLFSLLYRLGLRIGEALAIDIEDIDFENEILLIHGKGRRKRKLPLISDMVILIRTWLALRPYLYEADSRRALFVSKKGNRLSIRTAQENFQKIVTKAGPFSINKVTPHSLRHAFATHAVEGDADLVVLKAVMGHASINSTQIYVHPSIKVLRWAVNDHIASDILGDLINDGVLILRTQQKWRTAA